MKFAYIVLRNGKPFIAIDFGEYRPMVIDEEVLDAYSKKYGITREELTGYQIHMVENPLLECAEDLHYGLKKKKDVAYPLRLTLYGSFETPHSYGISSADDFLITKIERSIRLALNERREILLMDTNGDTIFHWKHGVQIQKNY